MSRSALVRGSALHKIAVCVMPPIERLLGGGALRERALLRLLGAHYASSYRRLWIWTRHTPHFYPQRWSAFEIVFRGRDGYGPYCLFRGFFNAEILQHGDRLLDIGCGDGFYASRFYARCQSIDAIDNDHSAIATAQKHSPNSRVIYYRQDAVTEPFPNPSYDVIAWDGALGHFDPAVVDLMLSKIATALADGGVFVGSEALGRVPNEDHLQMFESREELASVLRKHFPVVRTKEISYQVRSGIRREGYWRCAMHEGRLRVDNCEWEAV